MECDEFYSQVLEHQEKYNPCRIIKSYYLGYFILLVNYKCACSTPWKKDTVLNTLTFINPFSPHSNPDCCYYFRHFIDAETDKQNLYTLRNYEIKQVKSRGFGPSIQKHHCHSMQCLAQFNVLLLVSLEIDLNACICR